VRVNTSNKEITFFIKSPPIKLSISQQKLKVNTKRKTDIQHAWGTCRMSVLLELTKNEKNEFGGGKYIKKIGDSLFL